MNNRYDVDDVSTEELEEVLGVKHRRELNKLVATYVKLNDEKVMISQYSCYNYYTTIQEDDTYLVTLIDEDGIIGDVLDVAKIVEVNDNRVELWIEL